MWELYDALIDAVPATARVRECVCGVNWFAVRSLGVGLAMAPGSGPAVLPQAGRYAGMYVRDLAVLLKSWNFHEATLGLAAINSALNHVASVEDAYGLSIDAVADTNYFEYVRQEFRGRKVALIGHFCDMERLKGMRSLTILERQPQAGDIPDPACEYVLKDQDLVCITSVTLINKTLPRLLQLSAGAKTVLIGPSTPLTPLLYDYGVDDLAGLVVEDEPAMLRIVQEGGQRRSFAPCTRMVTLPREGIAAGAVRAAARA